MKAIKSETYFNTWVIEWELDKNGNYIDKEHIKGGLFFNSLEEAEVYITGIKSGKTHETLYQA